MSDIAVLDVGDRVGPTQYIDFIKPEELTSNIMRGVDIFQRHFVVMRGRVTIHDDYGNAITDEEDWMQTFFQRYTGNNELWVGCGDRELLQTSGGLSLDQSEFLADLIDNKQATIPVAQYRVNTYLENAAFARVCI